MGRTFFSAHIQMYSLLEVLGQVLLSGALRAMDMASGATPVPQERLSRMGLNGRIW
jgi:hypothetical protein